LLESKNFGTLVFVQPNMIVKSGKAVVSRSVTIVFCELQAPPLFENEEFCFYSGCSIIPHL